MCGAQSPRDEQEQMLEGRPYWCFNSLLLTALLMLRGLRVVSEDSPDQGSQYQDMSETAKTRTKENLKQPGGEQCIPQ